MDPRGFATLSVHLDTNVLLWLSRRRQSSLGAQAARLARNHVWLISPAVILELEILHEIGRIKVSVDQVLSSAKEIGDMSVSQTAYAEVVREARSLSWTRDPMDRLIVAHAIHDGARLLTADGRILANFKDAVWD